MTDEYGTQTTWETQIKVEERHKIAAMDWLDHDETIAQRAIDSLPIAFARFEASLTEQPPSEVVVHHGYTEVDSDKMAAILARRMGAEFVPHDYEQPPSDGLAERLAEAIDIAEDALDGCSRLDIHDADMAGVRELRIRLAALRADPGAGA